MIRYFKMSINQEEWCALVEFRFLSFALFWLITDAFVYCLSQTLGVPARKYEFSLPNVSGCADSMVYAFTV